MGLFQWAVKISNPGERRREEKVNHSVDTDAVMSVIPAKRLKKIGIEPSPFPIDLEVMDSCRISRWVGYVIFQVEGKSALRPVVFGEIRDRATLGADVLQATGLWVEPKKERLIVPEAEA